MATTRWGKIRFGVARWWRTITALVAPSPGCLHVEVTQVATLTVTVEEC